MQRGLDVRLISHHSLVAHMKYRDLTVRTLAARTGVNRSTIGHLRSGQRTTCRPEHAKAIAKALDVPVSALFIERSALRVAHNAA